MLLQKKSAMLLHKDSRPRGPTRTDPSPTYLKVIGSLSLSNRGKIVISLPPTYIVRRSWISPPPSLSLPKLSTPTMAEEKESTSVPLSQAVDPEDPAKTPPPSPNSTRKVRCSRSLDLPPFSVNSF